MDLYVIIFKYMPIYKNLLIMKCSWSDPSKCIVFVSKN